MAHSRSPYKLFSERERNRRCPFASRSLHTKPGIDILPASIGFQPGYIGALSCTREYLRLAELHVASVAFHVARSERCIVRRVAAREAWLSLSLSFSIVRPVSGKHRYGRTDIVPRGKEKERLSTRSPSRSSTRLKALS